MKFLSLLLVLSLFVGVLKGAEVGPTEYATLVKVAMSANKSDSMITGMIHEHTESLEDDQLQNYSYLCAEAAIEADRPAILTEIINRFGINLNADAFHYNLENDSLPFLTLLSKAVCERAHRCLETLIEDFGADVNSRLYSGIVPIYLAAQFGNYHAFLMMLEAGADMDSDHILKILMTTEHAKRPAELIEIIEALRIRGYELNDSAVSREMMKQSARTSPAQIFERLFNRFAIVDDEKRTPEQKLISESEMRVLLRGTSFYASHNARLILRRMMRELGYAATVGTVLSTCAESACGRGVWANVEALVWWLIEAVQRFQITDFLRSPNTRRAAHFLWFQLVVILNITFNLMVAIFSNS